MNNILLATGITATGVYLWAKTVLSFERFMEKLEKKALQERIANYEKNNTEQKIIKKHFADLDVKEQNLMQKLKSKDYQTKKEFFDLIKGLEIIKAEKANGFVVSPARKKLEVMDFIEWGVVEYEETYKMLEEEEKARQTKTKEKVNKVLPTILTQYKGKNLDQIKAMTR